MLVHGSDHGASAHMMRWKARSMPGMRTLAKWIERMIVWALLILVVVLLAILVVVLDAAQKQPLRSAWNRSADHASKSGR